MTIYGLCDPTPAIHGRESAPSNCENAIGNPRLLATHHNKPSHLSGYPQRILSLLVHNSLYNDVVFRRVRVARHG